MTFNREIVQVLCPYGEWPHSQGMQLVDEEAAAKMKKSARFAGTFSLGIPIYIGHPDEAGSRQRARTVGRIKKICSTDGGIAVVASYDDDTFKKIKSGKLKAMSPRWQMEKLPDGKYRPIRLISAGLTNNPNIPGSGKIISAAAPKKNETAKELASCVKTLSEKYGRTLQTLKNCAKKAEDLKLSIDESVVAERIATLKKDSPKPERRRTVRELGMMALERSRRTGEAYTKSFAAVRKEYL